MIACFIVNCLHIAVQIYQLRHPFNNDNANHYHYQVKFEKNPIIRKYIFENVKSKSKSDYFFSFIQCLINYFMLKKDLTVSFPRIQKYKAIYTEMRYLL